MYDLAKRPQAGSTNASAAKNATAAAAPAAAAPAAKSLVQMTGVPVFIDPALQQNAMGDADLQQREYIIDGLSGIDFVQTRDEDDNLNININGKDFSITPDDSSLVQIKAKNPVENPPFNNWSTNQPSPPHSKGLYGDEDLGWRNLVIDGVNGFDLTQT
jgi:hypothetical protein